MENWKKKTIIYGGLLGLVAGIAASYIIVQRSEKSLTRPQMNAADSIKFGLGFLTFMKLITDIVVED